jgi:hypothetical protein
MTYDVSTLQAALAAQPTLASDGKAGDAIEVVMQVRDLVLLLLEL